MLPGDVVGTQIFNPHEGSYTVRNGPVFGKRAPPSRRCHSGIETTGPSLFQLGLYEPD